MYILFAGDMETYWLTGVANSASNAVPGRYKANQDSLLVPGQYTSKSISIMSGLDVVASPELVSKHLQRTGSVKSATMHRAGSFRQRERTKSTSMTTSSRSSESLARHCELVPLIAVSDNEQSALSKDNAAVVIPPTIQIDEYM